MIKFGIGCLFFILISLMSCMGEKHKKFHQSNTIKNNPYQFDEFSEEDFEALGKAQIDSNSIQIIHSFYKYFWEDNNLWGGFLVAQGNEIIFERYRGYCNYEKKDTITPNTSLHLASISKNLTAMVVLKLIEQNYLTINQPVWKILPEFPYKDITIFQLLTHRSGLGNYDKYAEDFGYAENGKDFTNQEMFKMFQECAPTLLFAPGTQHSYCNTNYAFLALIIEKITKMSYPEAMKKILFEPLNMNDTFVFQKKDFGKVCPSYYQRQKPWPYDFRDLIYGDKNIYSTPRDLFAYSEAMFTDKFMRKSLLDSAMVGYSYERKGIKNYGFGFRLREFDNGKKIIFHTGSWHGNNSIFIHLPEEKVTIIALGNKSGRANYAAYTLSGLFGDYPFDVKGSEELLMATQDSITIDSIQYKVNKIKELKKQNPVKETIKKNKVDTVKKISKSSSLDKVKAKVVPTKKKKKDSVKNTNKIYVF